jgi:putative chitinase
MCISASVGVHGQNARPDVIIVQILLNYNKAPTAKDIGVDGTCGDGTKAAIREFQSRVGKMPKPDGRVDPGGNTLKLLGQGIPKGDIDQTKLRGIMPATTVAKLDRYTAPLVAGMKQRSISTPLRQAHFLAQLGHESMSFVYSEELASGEAYEGREDLGNTQPGDGQRFKGRGLIQLTGRSNYEAYGEDKGRDFTSENNPSLIATDPGLAVDVSCWFWNNHNLNSLADADNVMGITHIINGGYNGIDDRKAYLRRAKFFLGL